MRMFLEICREVALHWGKGGLYWLRVEAARGRGVYPNPKISEMLQIANFQPIPALQYYTITIIGMHL